MGVRVSFSAPKFPFHFTCCRFLQIVDISLRPLCESENTLCSLLEMCTEMSILDVFIFAPVQQMMEAKEPKISLEKVSA